MSKKMHIAILCGGQSAEHEISLLSARNVVNNLDPKKYEPIIIYLSQQGRWYWVDPKNENFEIQKEKPLVLIPGNSNKPFALEKDTSEAIQVDCVIPMLHGTCGEDGTVQGLLQVLNVAYVGSDVLGSAICMEKMIAKRLLRFAGLPTPDWVMIDVHDKDQVTYKELVKQLGVPFFIKPVGLGSSVGISKVRNEAEYQVAVRDAFQYDDQLLAERFIEGREMECSVLGNDEPVASLPGELITKHEFYSYEAKYHDPDLKFITPVELPAATVKQIQDLAIAAFKTLQCSGMARVDFFLTKEQEILINEVNTIPGFTNVSMYPVNWKVSGLEFTNLLDDLIQLALAKYHNESKLSHYYLGPPSQSQEISQRGKELE